VRVLQVKDALRYTRPTFGAASGGDLLEGWIGFTSLNRQHGVDTRRKVLALRTWHPSVTSAIRVLPTGIGRARRRAAPSVPKLLPPGDSAFVRTRVELTGS
jgi:hypothetical protein